MESPREAWPSASKRSSVIDRVRWIEQTHGPATDGTKETAPRARLRLPKHFIDAHQSTAQKREEEQVKPWAPSQAGEQPRLRLRKRSVDTAKAVGAPVENKQDVLSKKAETAPARDEPSANNSTEPVVKEEPLVEHIAEEEKKPIVEPIKEEGAEPLVEPAVKKVNPPAEPIREPAVVEFPVKKTEPPAVKPIASNVQPLVKSVVKKAVTLVEPIPEKAEAFAEPAIKRTEPFVKPIIKKVEPLVEPIAKMEPPKSIIKKAEPPKPIAKKAEPPEPTVKKVEPPKEEPAASRKPQADAQQASPALSEASTRVAAEDPDDHLEPNDFLMYSHQNSSSSDIEPDDPVHIDKEASTVKSLAAGEAPSLGGIRSRTRPTSARRYNKTSEQTGGDLRECRSMTNLVEDGSLLSRLNKLRAHKPTAQSLVSNWGAPKFVKRSQYINTAPLSDKTNTSIGSWGRSQKRYK
ncbi:hypothetical protein GGI25_005502 [Coemansia spiralis]|uniref:Uncharacterized protein n=2 Tax=Coemansia TaxID=4863 RepID=A0A9W8KW66_9FUNG|nr:hypothetical protein BX070DRAFT_251204 [Coemansia spiralis]KAJ1987961.1 hypothetical protein EDC05_005554 [Coemansia umbellata]KAJ2619520.1 hypothetical protein GGI26_005758 [Coemansia sp. RSA 1358]KAJ2671384.1 hypothetical protein GGI25_005502 [Coemansia spiralis]